MGYSLPNSEDEARKELAVVQEFNQKLGEVSGRLNAAHRDLVALLRSHPCGIEVMRREYQRRHAESARASIADTEVARRVFATLDRALRHRKMVVLEGEPGIGKTRAVETWCEMHLGEARFVTLSGCVNKSSIFHKIELSLGLSFGQPKKTTQMQSAVESMLKRSGMMLVVDKSHFLFSQGNRITSRPEMLDWIDTSCCNEGVPVALIATPQFTECLAHVEKRTLWQSKQFRRRIKDYAQLPFAVPESDIEAVARNQMPQCGSAAIKLVMGFALTSSYPLSYIANAVEDAREIARADGREHIEFRDVDRAIKDYRMPSELAQKAAFDKKSNGRVSGTPARASTPEESRNRSGGLASPQLDCTGLAAPLVTENRIAVHV